MNDKELDEMLSLVVAPAPPPSLRRGLAAALPVVPRRKIFGIPPRWAVTIGAAALCALVGAAALNIGPVEAQFYGRVDSPEGPLYVVTTRLVDPSVGRLKPWFLGLGDGFSFGGTAASLHGSTYLRNRFNKTFAGYQYTMDQIREGQYRITFSPLDAGTLENLLQPFKINGQIVPTPSLPEPSIVQIGEPFEVTLYQSAGERIYDRILVSWAAPRRVRNPAPAVTLRLTGPQLYVNGQLALIKANAGAGPVIWVRLPGQGRVLAALDPQHNPLFVQSGHVNGSVMEFRSEGIQFRIVCQQPITTGGDRPIFVYHQQSFEEALDPANPLSQQPMLGNAGPASLHQAQIPN